MLKEVDFFVFKELVPLYLYNDIDYLSITAKLLKAKVVCYVYKKDDEDLVGFALFKKRRKIVVPNFQIFYSGIWLKYSLEHKNGRDNLYAAVNCLKELHNQIKLILPLTFSDVRPFKWHGFDVDVRYTYVKETSKYGSVKRDVRSNYKNSKGLAFVFEPISFSDFDWIAHANHLTEMGCSNRKIKLYQQWFSDLDLKNKLLCFEVQQNDEILGSGILLLDQKRTAYFILRNIPKGEHQKEVNAFLYIEVLKWLNNNGYNYLDYMGANMRSIADFKDRFLPVLKPYYIVAYNANTVLSLEKVKGILRALVIKYFRY